MLNCLNAQKRQYNRKQTIFMIGENVTSVGIVLTGNVHIIKEDIFGNRAILADSGEGDLFCESFSCSQTEKLPVTVVAATDSIVLMINYRRIITTCSSACEFHSRLVENMLGILAYKNIALNRKVDYLSKRTTRDKLIEFLSFHQEQANDNVFTIPFNRQELADYLCVDRSAMSNELSKMRDEGLIKFEKNKFELFLD
ncbi:Crp/Fnr family transcriptional regulator [Selenomonadales bacterium OttesenSCG-928-I06]|nr:Crp/Fnr family transcriptional regulator [Selenomonadales bacterium OttesenSCG-928-I06]